jgi:hypothetical protein
VLLYLKQFVCRINTAITRISSLLVVENENIIDDAKFEFLQMLFKANRINISEVFVNLNIYDANDKKYMILAMVENYMKAYIGIDKDEIIAGLDWMELCDLQEKKMKKIALDGIK